MESWSGITAKDGRSFELGDLVRVVCRPDDATFEGFLNEVTEDYIILVGAGSDWAEGVDWRPVDADVPVIGSSLGFLWPNIKSMVKVEHESE